MWIADGRTYCSLSELKKLPRMLVHEEDCFNSSCRRWTFRKGS